MAQFQSPEVEILIHITAPSRAADDEKCRSLAFAYLDFEPAASLPTSSAPLIGSVGSVGSGAGRSDHGHYILQQQQTSQGRSQHDPRLSGQVALFESPMASFQSVLDNANSPRIVTRNRARLMQASPEFMRSQATQSTWQSPPSMVEDSIPQNHVTSTAFTSPTRVLEHYLQAFDSSSQAHTRSSGANSEQIIAGTPVRPQDSQGDKENHRQNPESTPVIPRTPFPATPVQQGGHLDQQITKNELGARNDLPDTRSVISQSSEGAIEETTLDSSFGIPPVGRADSEPLPSRKAQEVAADSTPRQLARTSSDTGPRTSVRKTTVVTVDFLASHGLKYESLELYAPDPPVSTSLVEPQGLVTPNLGRLAKSLETEKPFLPKEQTRELRPTERGYWLLDCATWSAELKRDCWAFLANYIGTGAAGWGVSCRRDADFRWVRTYCWGTVVPHIYQLLYLATQREVLFTGAAWVGGDGETVVVMGARERR